MRARKEDTIALHDVLPVNSASWSAAMVVSCTSKASSSAKVAGVQRRQR